MRRTANNNGYLITDGQPICPNGSNAVPLLLQDDDPTVVPTIGFILEF